MRAFVLALAAASALALPAKAQDVTVAVTAIVEHPALDAARDGVKALRGSQGAHAYKVYFAREHMRVRRQFLRRCGGL